MITSSSNPAIKHARSLARKKERLAAKQFLVEGLRLIQEAVRAGLVPAQVFYERAAFNNDPRLRALVDEPDRRATGVDRVDLPLAVQPVDTREAGDRRLGLPTSGGDARQLPDHRGGAPRQPRSRAR